MHAERRGLEQKSVAQLCIALLCWGFVVIRLDPRQGIKRWCLHEMPREEKVRSTVAAHVILHYPQMASTVLVAAPIPSLLPLRRRRGTAPGRAPAFNGGGGGLLLLLGL